ncbi:MAG: hypothetical protein ACD_45C00730G0003 [uncultured bacterium]|nr:MAG: hypothetical protein ACD_45C00730G0003 [uncultured bacterium]
MSLPRTLFVDKPKNTDSKETPVIQVFTDFDGTLTGRPGGETVVDVLYRSLQKNPNTSFDRATFLAEKEMVAKLQAGLKEEKNKDMGLVEGAAKFLQTMLNYNAEIVLVSKNRKEYIAAVLQAAGMSKQNISKILIIDRNDLMKVGGSKERAVTEYLKDPAHKAAAITVVSDDDLKDFFAMRQAVTDAGLSDTLIAYDPTNEHFKQYKRFDWAAITKEITQKIKPDSHPRPNV